MGGGHPSVCVWGEGGGVEMDREGGEKGKRGGGGGVRPASALGRVLQAGMVRSKRFFGGGCGCSRMSNAARK
jgi:hypothetical protein